MNRHNGFYMFGDALYTARFVLPFLPCHSTIYDRIIYTLKWNLFMFYVNCTKCIWARSHGYEELPSHVKNFVVTNYSFSLVLL